MESPFFIQWHFTNACNLRCKHCYQDDFSGEKDLDRQGLQRISKNLFDALEAWGRTASIHLTGGEPLLHPHLFPLLEELNRHPLVEELGVITNGLRMTREMVQSLARVPKLKPIKISLDGGTAGAHEFLRPAGTFQRVLDQLPVLQEEGRFEILLMFTVLKKNLDSLPSLLALGRDLGVDGLILERFIPWGRGREIRGEALDRNAWRRVIRHLSDFFSWDEEEIASMPYQAFQVKYGGGEPELLGAPCIVGWDGLCIMPEGEVFPCRRFPISIGNLLDRPLKEIWEQSELIRTLRQKENLKGKCGRCPIRDCRGCRSLAFALTGDYLAEDPHCSDPVPSG